MEVQVSALRAHLKTWIDRARSGDDVIVTERGNPIARIVAVDQASTIDRLTREGVISVPPRAVRPKATGRKRISSRGSVSELVRELRD